MILLNSTIDYLVNLYLIGCIFGSAVGAALAIRIAISSFRDLWPVASQYSNKGLYHKDQLITAVIIFIMSLITFIVASVASWFTILYIIYPKRKKHEQDPQS